MAVTEEEKAFYARIEENLIQAEYNGKIILTWFLSLREQEIVKELAATHAVSVEFFGGFEDAERKKAVISPADIPVKKQFHIACYQLLYNKRYLKITHSNVLGTLMSLKIDRGLFGDIIFKDDDCYFFCSADIEALLLNEFTAINKVPVTVQRYEEPLDYEQQYETKEIIVSSLRIDAMISRVYNLSREKAQELIRSKAVYRNFQPVNNNDDPLTEQDIISVRKYGRFLFSSIIRTTKTEKFVLEIKIPVM